MANHHNPQPDAQTEQYKPIFLVRMIRVNHDPGIFIKKGGSRLFKGDAMLLLIGLVLALIPFKTLLVHT